MERWTTWPLNYIALWVAACAVGAVLFLVEPRQYALAQGSYWRFLRTPWRLGFFLVAWAGIVLVAPYTGDVTWDWVDASFMAILAFTTAPFCLGTFWAVKRGERPRRQLWVAAVVWLFSASWSYDIYLFLRDGYYPATWWANLAASSWLYLMAGGFWSLEADEERGAHFAFRRQGWPIEPDAGSWRRLWPYALFLLAPVGLFFLAFPLLHFGGWL